MEKNYPEITKNISANLKVLRKDIADTMQGFSAMAQSASKDGVIRCAFGLSLLACSIKLCP